MERARLIFALLFAVIIGGGSIISATAQEATPEAEEPPLVLAETPEAGEEEAVPIQEQISRPVAHPGGDLPGDVEVALVKVADGFYEPVNVASPPDGTGRLFVVDRPGLIRIIDENGEVLEEPFLDLTEIVITAGLEQGLLDMAFHPNYEENGYFYVHYTDWRTTGDSFITRYQVSPDDPNVADPESAKVILAVDQPFVNHNGGKIEFGPDGYLYIALGDGGGAGDPYETAQHINDLLGSLLRINVDDEEAGRAYAIPEDNPFEGTVLYSPVGRELGNEDLYHPAAAPEIWGFGLRNPWQFSFDPETGDLYLTDVGQNFWEEVNFIPRDAFGEAVGLGGFNFGWDFLEGAHCFPMEQTECGQVGILPVAEYPHVYGCSITGLGVSRAEDAPSLDGIYFNSDYCTGRIWGLARDENGTWQYEELLDTELLITGSGQSETGEVYATSCECVTRPNVSPLQAEPLGAVWQIVPADQVPEGAELAPLTPPEEEEVQEEAPIPEAEEEGVLPTEEDEDLGTEDDITPEAVEEDEEA